MLFFLQWLKKLSEYLEEHSCERQPLFLSAAELEPPFADNCIIAVWHREHCLVQRGGPRCAFHLLPRRPRPAIANVIENGVIKQDYVLRNRAHRAPQRLEVPLRDAAAPYGHHTGCGVVESEKQAQEGGFSRAGGTNKRAGAACRDGERHAIEDGRVRAVPEVDIFKSNVVAATGLWQLWRSRW